MNYTDLKKQLQSLTEDCPYVTTNLANASALLFENLPDINWAGFYERIEDKLILGPFQGRPACIEIPVGRGVCGTAVQEKKVQRVADVHAFKGHIACDSASRSEIVIPLFLAEKIWGVLDIDSPVKNRFQPEDEAGLLEIAEVIQGFLKK